MRTIERGCREHYHLWPHDGPPMTQRQTYEYRLYSLSPRSVAAAVARSLTRLAGYPTVITPEQITEWVGERRGNLTL